MQSELGRPRTEGFAADQNRLALEAGNHHDLGMNCTAPANGDQDASCPSALLTREESKLYQVINTRNRPLQIFLCWAILPIILDPCIYDPTLCGDPPIA